MWSIVLDLDVEYSVFWLVTSLLKEPCYFLPYYLQSNLTLKSALLLVTVLSACKWYTFGYWIFYSQNSKSEWLVLILLQILLDWTMKGTFYAIVYWSMMIIVHSICMFLIFLLSLFSRKLWISDLLSFLPQLVLKQSKNYIKFHFQFQSKSALETSLSPLHISSKHQTAD